jgi:hypothetical protein
MKRFRHSEIGGSKVRNSWLCRDTVLDGLLPKGFVELTLGDHSEIIGE